MALLSEVVKQGDHGTELFIIRSGEVTVLEHSGSSLRVLTKDMLLSIGNSGQDMIRSSHGPASFCVFVRMGKLQNALPV